MPTLPRFFPSRSCRYDGHSARDGDRAESASTTEGPQMERDSRDVESAGTDATSAEKSEERSPGSERGATREPSRAAPRSGSRVGQ